jgi:hypothetical protein
VKLLCDACERLSEAASLRVASGQVFARCGRCGAEGSLGALDGELEVSVEVPLAEVVAAVPTPAAMAPTTPPPRAEAAPLLLVQRAAPGAAPAAAEEDPYEVPAGRCPKCVAVRPAAAVNCAQCGLAYARFVPADHRLRAGLDRAWRELLKRWEDPAAHDKLLARAQAEEALPQVARMYQIRLARNEADAMALRAREELLRRVTVSASAAVKPPGGAPAGRSRKRLWMGLAGGLGLLLLVLQLLSGRGG